MQTSFYHFLINCLVLQFLFNLDSCPVESFSKLNWIEFISSMVEIVFTKLQSGNISHDFVQYFIGKWTEIPSIYDEFTGVQSFIRVIFANTPQNTFAQIKPIWIVEKFKSISNEKSIILWNQYGKLFPSKIG
jgi:hypothetical protein